MRTAVDETDFFSISAKDIDLLIKANKFSIPKSVKIITLAIRGAVLEKSHQEIDTKEIKIEDVIPDHINFRCLLGFYDVSAQRVTLLSGSTIPCPKYMKNYYFKENNLPHKKNFPDCNMLPTGCYFFRVGSHGGGKVSPALRMSDPDNLSSDGEFSVTRTTNDLTYGIGDNCEQPRKVYDNVHCSYLVNYSDNYEAYFSSAG